jgi:superfamily II DNA or RNA helicase
MNLDLFNPPKEIFYTLRGYQDRACNDVMSFILQYVDSSNKIAIKGGIVVIPTAGGKSLVIGNVASRIEKCLVLQPSKELLEQNWDKYQSYGMKGALYSASLSQRNVGHTTFATLGSIKEKAELFKKIGVKVVLVDECFTGDTYIRTLHGNKKIKTLVGKQPIVLSYNKEGVFEYKKANKVWSNGVKAVNEYQFSFQKIRCTENHKLLTVDGWKMAKELKKDDLVLVSGRSRGTYMWPTDDQKQLFYGSVIGDGYFEGANNGFSSRLKVVHGQSQLDYLLWKRDMVNDSLSIEHVSKNGYAQTPANRFQGKQAYFLPNDKEAIDNLTPLGFAIAWMDDGSVNNNTGRVYSFSTKYNLICQYRDKINSLFGVDSKVLVAKKREKSYYYIQINASSFKKISSVIKRYIHPSMSYKLHEDHRDKVGTYVFNNRTTYVRRYTGRFKPIGMQEVFDMEVDGNHNFVVPNKKTAHGVVAHNCHFGFPPDPDSMFMTFIKELNPKVVVGFTATPIRLISRADRTAELVMLNRVKSAFFKNIIHVTQIQEIAPKYWSDLLFTRYTYDNSFLKTNKSGTEYTEESIIASNELNFVNKRIYLDLKRRLINSKRSILVFVDSVENAYIFRQMFPSISDVVEGKTNKKDRTSIVKAFKNGNLKIVFNVGVFTTGFDYPELDCIIMGRPTRSFALWYQIAGRGTRQHEDKLLCEVIDMCDNTARHGDIRNVTFEEIDGIGWGMFNGGILMTGNDINKPLPSIEEAAEEGKRLELNTYIRNSNKKNYTVMSFGTHRGTKVEDLETSYLNYMVDQINKTEAPRLQAARFRNAAVDILKQRSANNFV